MRSQLKDASRIYWWAFLILCIFLLIKPLAEIDGIELCNAGTPSDHSTQWATAISVRT